ncbi:MAG: VIT domain-containing protein [Bacteroidota bacterium]
MKTLISFVWLLFFTAISTAQQAPILKVGNTQVGLSNLEITVEIIGNKATTTFDMLYYNPTNSVLEGELSFPLGENFDVSRFALDVNGKLREAVVVDKELGRIAFEEVVRRRIDPALLEKGSGNNYKARIYPIPAKSYKRVVLAYEQELLYKADDYYYDLPLHFKNQLDKFSLDITVFEQEEKPIIEKGKVSGLNFSNWQRNFRTQLEKSKYTPNKSLLIKIPTKVNTLKTLVSDDYFYSHIIVNPQKKLRNKPTEISLYWDASLSMKDRDLDKEISLLDRYFSYIQNSKVHFTSFSNTIRATQTFTITNGNWKALKDVLNSTVYDGGTSYEILQNITQKSELLLLFSDGIQSLSDAIYDAKTPMIVINSGEKSNHAALKTMAEASRGTYVNLTVKSAAEAFDDLKYQQYQYLGLKSNTKGLDVYPKTTVNVDNTFSIAGKNLTDNQEITLYFGYDNQITESVQIPLKKVQKSTTQIPRLWAQKRLDFLQKNSKIHKKEIIKLATTYGLVTDYTSLIVLEDVRDYVRYQIEPPAELLEAYNKLVAEMERTNETKKNLVESPGIIEEVEEVEVQQLSYDEVGRESNEHRRTNVTSEAVRMYNDQSANSGLTRGNQLAFQNIEVVEDEEEVIEEVPFTIIEESPTFSGCENATNSIERKRCTTTKIQELVITNFNISAINELNLSEGIQRAFALFTINKEGIIEDIRVRASHPRIEAEVKRVIRLLPQMRPGHQRGINIDVRYTLPIIFRVNTDGNVSPSSTIQTNPVLTVTQPETPIKQYNGNLQVADARLKAPYIEELRQFTTEDEAYEFYLIQRKKYAGVPMYYVDVATFFRNAFKAVLTSDRILSNIAETDFDNYELLKVFGYQLQVNQQHKLALFIFQRILELRTEDVQSYRDLALAYENVGDCQEAFNILNEILSGDIYKNTHRRNFRGLNEVIMHEMNYLLEKYKGDIDTSQQTSIVLEPETFDVRIVVDWNHNDTDIDLHIIDPNLEECSYSNTETKIGGRMSKDMTQGFGPEEFTLKNAIKGNYFIKVNYYGDRYQKIENPTFMKVTMYAHYGTLKQTKEVKMIRLTNAQDKQIVAKMVF